jgi:hypothetical protein
MPLELVSGVYGLIDGAGVRVSCSDCRVCVDRRRRDGGEVGALMTDCRFRTGCGIMTNVIRAAIRAIETQTHFFELYLRVFDDCRR